MFQVTKDVEEDNLQTSFPGSNVFQGAERSMKQRSLRSKEFYEAKCSKEKNVLAKKIVLRG